MIDIFVERFETGVGTESISFTENIYLLYSDSNSQGIIIDPGNINSTLEQFIAEKQIQILAILNTHGHWDHIGANKYYSEKYSVPIWGNISDTPLYELNIKNSPTNYFDKETELNIGIFTFRIITTPGHSMGSTCFLIENILFSGDTLFKESIGKTWGDSIRERKQKAQQEIDNIKRKLLILPEDTIVYPGHRNETTIGYETKYNPYLNK